MGCYQSAHGQRGIIDRRGRISTIADPAAGSHGGTCALSINDAGVITGWYARPTGPTRGFIDRHGTFTSITAPGAGTRTGTGTLAIGINDSDVIVGFIISTRFEGEHGFVLKKGKFSLVKVPTGTHSSVVAAVLNGIADDGTITGWYQGAKDIAHSFIDRAGTFTAIAVPHAVQTFVACISADGHEAVGIYTTTRNGTVNHGFSYRSGIYRTINDPAGIAGTSPQCVNNAGVVVGYYNFKKHSTATRAFRFTPRGPATTAKR